MTIDQHLIEPVLEIPEKQIASAPRFAAAKAFGAVALLLLAQFLAGATVIFVWTIVALARGQDATGAGFAERISAESTPVMLLASAVVSTLVVLGLTRLWAWHLISANGSPGLGLSTAPVATVLAWAAVGIALASVYLSAVQWWFPPVPGTPLGPLATAVVSGGLNRVAWAAIALIFAPVVEEFFFRGLLFHGFTTSWGPRVAAAVVTVLFVAMHLLETVHYWPATAAVVFVGFLTVVARMTSGSLIPSMALHFAYNSVIALAVFGWLGAA